MEHCGRTWEDFWRAYLQISKREADRTIPVFDEFGPDYFDLWTRTRDGLARVTLQNGVQ